MVDLRFSGCLKCLFRDVVYRRFNAAASSAVQYSPLLGMPVNKIALACTRANQATILYVPQSAHPFAAPRCCAAHRVGRFRLAWHLWAG